MDKQISGYEAAARAASKSLDDKNITPELFKELYQKWWEAKYDWRVHLGLVMSTRISKERFLQLLNKHQGEICLQEECLAQAARFDFTKAEKELVLGPFLPNSENHSNPYKWSTLERIAMEKQQKREP